MAGVEVSEVGACVVGVASVAVLLAGVVPVEAQPASMLVMASMANNEPLLYFIHVLHLSGHGRKLLSVLIFNVAHR